MRVSRAEMAAHHRQIVEAAADLFRERGLDAVSVDTLMQRAGLTHGGFYRHFASKNALAAEAIQCALEQGASRQAGFTDLGELVASYLSERHRADRTHGCCIAALGSDIARHGRPLRALLTGQVRIQIDRIAALLRDLTAARRRRRAIAVLSGMVGALILGRAVDDPALAKEILAAGRDMFGGVSSGADIAALGHHI